jgi:hypothetical protein
MQQPSYEQWQQPPWQPQPHTDPPSQPQWQQPPTQYPPPYPQQQSQYYPPPPTYYQPPMQPPVMFVQQPPPPKRHNGCLIAIAVLVALFIFGSIVNAISGTQNSSTTANTAQPTDTPTPTPDLKSLGGIQQYTLQLAQNSTSADSSTVTSAYEPQAKTITIDETLSEQYDNSAYRGDIQHDCYSVEQAIWQGHIPHLSLVEVDISGPLVDKYGNPSTGLLGYCILKHSTEKMFQWNNLTWEQAWNDYDTAWMLPSLNQ